MSEHRSVAVSPRHWVRLSSDYAPVLDRAPERDFVVHTLERRLAGDTPLMTAEIVIASARIREQFPLAATYPLHFRKKYFAARLHGDPQQEYAHALHASRVTDCPPPIGASHDEFRSCLIPGTAYRTLCVFDPDSEDQAMRAASSLPLLAAAGLWTLAQAAYDELQALHRGGLSHGDAALQNFIVCTSPLEVVLVDYEAAAARADVDAASWAARCLADRVPLLKQALFLQATLGRQRGTLAETAWDAGPRLLHDFDRLRRAIDRLGRLD